MVLRTTNPLLARLMALPDSDLKGRMPTAYDPGFGTLGWHG